MRSPTQGRLINRKQADSYKAVAIKGRKNGSVQSIFQVIMKGVIEATKAAVIAVREADNPVTNARQIHTTPKSSSPALREPTFDWKATNKCQDLRIFEIGVKNTFVTNNNYNTQGSHMVPIILNWLGWDRLRFVQTLSGEEQEKYKANTELFKV